MKKATLLFLCILSSLSAKPQGGAPQSGKVDIIEQGQKLFIKSGKKAIIHWDQFSIDPHEIVHFLQKDKQSRVLNRVMGKDLSHIQGVLKSNGQVFLINPNGILIGPQGHIQTAGFLASTLDVHDDAFLNGESLLFHSPGPGTITNLGTVECPYGDIVLLARAIKDEGSLSAKDGIVALGAGVEVLLKPNGDERISIRPDLILPNGEEEVAIEHKGQIEALSIEMKTSKNPFEKAINSTGSITALSKREENGHVYLVASGSRTTVSGFISQPGGEVHLLGDQVHIEKTTTIDVSDRDQGGNVLIGGDERGENPEIPNAKMVYVERGAEIYADGLDEGSGGKIISWGDEGNAFYGSAYARGGDQGGDGGFVEVSSKGMWDFDGHVLTCAPQGNGGTLLFDPSDIVINANPTNPGPFNPPFTYNPAFAGTATLNSGSVQTALMNGNNVVVATSNGSAPGVGQVTIDANVGITWGTANSFTIIADRNIIISSGAVISSTYNGATPNFPLIDFQGLGTPNTADFQGIFIDGSTVEVNNGNMVLTGTGGEYPFNRGILIENSGIVRGNGTGSVTLTGTADVLGTPPGPPVQNKEGVSIGTMGPSIGTVEVNNGDLFITGTGGNGFLSQGVEVNFNGAIRSIGSGNITIQGQGGNTTGDFSTGFVIGTATVEATGTGSISITGFGEGTGNNSIGVNRFPEAFAPGSGIIQTQSGNITVNAVGAPSGGTNCPGLALQGPVSGSGVLRTNNGGSISIMATGGGNDTSPGVIITQGLITTTSGGNITIDNTVGGGGSGSDGVQITGTNSSITTTGPSGNISINATGGSSGTGNSGVNINTAGDIRSTNGSITVDGRAGPNGGGSYGVSVTGANSAIAASFGTVNVTGRANGGSHDGILVSDGGAITSGGNAFIQTFSDLVIMNGSSVSSSSGTMNVNVTRDILLSNGGSIGGNLQTQVLAGRDIILTGTGTGARIIGSTSTLSVIAGRNLIMTADTDFFTLIAALGDVTIVVDNAFPSPPDIGPGYLSKDAFSHILANFDGSNAVRIFTARQPLNTILGNINFVPFTAGMEFIDTNQERWGIYFPSAIGGNPFTTFYKDDIQDTITRLINDLMIANAQLSDLSPLFPRYRKPLDFRYVGNVCEYAPKTERLRCRPDFDPYGSFIFEDQVFWIGEEWTAPRRAALLEFLKTRSNKQSDL